MAHVKFKKPRAKKVRPSKPVPPPRPHRPKRGDLRKIYRDLLTADRDQRVTTLAKAMAWYDLVQAYISYKQKGKLSTHQLRNKNAAEKVRNVGISSNNDVVKEQKFVETIKEYEKLVKSFRPPLISKILTRYNRSKKKLETRKKKLTDKYGQFLELISHVLHPKNSHDQRIELRVDKISSPYRIDSSGNITFDRKIVVNLRRTSRKHGLLSGVIEMLPVLSESAARTPELDLSGHKTGRTLVSSKKRYNSVLEMLNHLNHYGLNDSTPRKLIRRPKTKKEESK